MLWPILIAAALTGCHSLPGPRMIRLQDLESAPPETPRPTHRHIVSDPDALRTLYEPLARRIGLVQVHDVSEWHQLALAAPQIGPCPDLYRGIVVGLVSPAGTSLNGDWPFNWDSIRLHEGAGLIEARFTPGNYLPDGTFYLETAQVEGLAHVLVVSVDGINYFPR